MNQPTESEFLDDVGLKKPDRSVAGTQASQMEVIPARACLLKMERDDRFQNEYSCDLTKGGYAEFD